MDVLFVLVQ